MTQWQSPTLIADAEWDTLSERDLVFQVERFGPLVEGLDTLAVSRNSEYELVCTLTHQHPSLFAQGADMKAGQITQGHELRAQGKGHPVVLEDVVAMRNEFTSSREGIRATAQLHTPRVVRTLADGKPERLAEWYLGGPRSAAFWRWTERRQRFEFSRLRSQGDLQTEPLTATQKLRDHIVLTPCPGLTLVLSEVQKIYGPSWSKNVCIEYSGECANTDPDVRAAVMEGISLFFGRRLLPIGESILGTNGELLVAKHWSPPAHARSLSSASDMRMCGGDLFDTEDQLNAFLRAYLEHRTELELSKVLRTLWVARSLPLGPDLAIYGAALERLMTAWYRSSRSKSRGVYMSKSDFERLLGPELASAAAKLAESEYGERITRRLFGAFNMGVNERIENFFNEIGLDVSPSELAAVKARNLSAHGSSGTDIDEAIQLKRCYVTLINRALLRLLGHQGTYTDYAVLGYPEKPLSEPCGNC
jgi:hypothetical protein